jgi:hypothetical protein
MTKTETETKPAVPPLTPEDRLVGLSERLWMPVSQLLGLVAAVALQLAALGTVGPIATLAGAGAGAALFFALIRRRDPRWLNRPRLFSLAGSTFGGMGLLGALAYLGCLWLIPEKMGEVVQHPFKAALAFGLIAAVVGGICTVIVGDLFAWRTGGYKGEPPPKRPRRAGSTRDEDDDEDYDDEDYDDEDYDEDLDDEERVSARRGQRGAAEQG